MAVVRIGVVRMGVRHGFMTVAMRMLPLNETVLAGMVVPMMHIVRVRMVVLQRFMVMGVDMVLGQMQPDAQSHQACCRQHLPGDGLGQK